MPVSTIATRIDGSPLVTCHASSARMSVNAGSPTTASARVAGAPGAVTAQAPSQPATTETPSPRTLGGEARRARVRPLLLRAGLVDPAAAAQELLQLLEGLKLRVAHAVTGEGLDG